MIRVEGGSQFSAVGQRLRATDDAALKKEFYSGINRAAKPLIGGIRKSALAILPSRGGLGKRVADSDIGAKRRMTGNAAGVRIVAKSGYDIGSINRGRVRHLVYGKPPWVNQRVPPKFGDTPIEAGAPAVEAALEYVIDRVSRKLEG